MSKADTVAAIRARRARRAGLKAIGALPRRRRPPRQLQPDAIRMAYLGALLGALGRVRELVRARLVPALPAIAAEAAAERVDGARADAWAQSVNNILDSLSDAWFAEWPNERLRRLAEVHAGRTADFQREQLAKQMKATLGIDVTRYEPWLRAKVEAFAGENVALIKSVATDYFGDLEKRLVAGLRTGQRWEELADLVEERYGVSESRAKLIARDQVGKLYGDLNRTRQTQLGVARYVWRTMKDNRVRDEHAELEGEEFSWAEEPEDGHPGFAVNCFPEGTLLSSPSRVLKAYRHRYSGELTTLVADSGESVSATPNHPVLTRRGWVPIQSVDVGEDVFQAPDQRGEVAIGDPQDVVTEAQQLFRAAEALGITKRVAGGGAWFHGDGTDEEVDVVDVDWGLCDEGGSALSQRFCQDVLARADDPALPLGACAQLFGAALLASNGSVRGGAKALSFILAGLTHPEEHGVSAAAWLESIADDLGANRGSRDAEAFRHLLHAPPLGVELGHHLARVVLGVVGRAVGGSAGLDAAVPQVSAEVVGMHAQGAGGLCEAHPLVQHPLRVAQKLVREYSGHVFNLQTASGWYVSQSLLVHNCRCFAEPVLGELLGEPPDTSEPPPAEAAVGPDDLPWAARPTPRARA